MFGFEGFDYLIFWAYVWKDSIIDARLKEGQRQVQERGPRDQLTHPRDLLPTARPH